eukprot:GHVQ01013119.1.p1 GENE.GHVQ01013119.1~~GHVQ01013119.1.p1  ORF type:complete len:336 (+),score=56.37 GHVQ01013119.1:250-1257(+)
MAEKRKLQQEVEKTLKRVDEGIALFDDVFEKVQSVIGSTSQKEKLENELKRELKKLQRYRDQIKAWQASSDIKDKGPLEDARRKIEKEMERFKIWEREFKMKAFSKEGLAAKAKMDPHEEERKRHKDWLNSVMAKLSTGVDEYEAETEVLSRKKTLNRRDQERTFALRTFVERHNWHLSKLEQILRRLENDTIDISLLDEIKDCVEYYSEQHDQADYFHDEDMYTDLNLEEPEDLSDVYGRKESEDIGSEIMEDDVTSEVLSTSPSNASKAGTEKFESSRRLQPADADKASVKSSLTAPSGSASAGRGRSSICEARRGTGTPWAEYNLLCYVRVA